jgi:hypothetical protein
MMIFLFIASHLPQNQVIRCTVWFSVSFRPVAFQIIWIDESLHTSFNKRVSLKLDPSTPMAMTTREASEDKLPSRGAGHSPGDFAGYEPAASVFPGVLISLTQLLQPAKKTIFCAPADAALTIRVTLTARVCSRAFLYPS